MKLWKNLILYVLIKEMVNFLPYSWPSCLHSCFHCSQWLWQESWLFSHFVGGKPNEDDCGKSPGYFWIKKIIFLMNKWYVFYSLLLKKRALGEPFCGGAAGRGRRGLTRWQDYESRRIGFCCILRPDSMELSTYHGTYICNICNAVAS